MSKLQELKQELRGELEILERPLTQLGVQKFLEETLDRLVDEIRAKLLAEADVRNLDDLTIRRIFTRFKEESV